MPSASDARCRIGIPSITPRQIAGGDLAKESGIAQLVQRRIGHRLIDIEKRDRIAFLLGSTQREVRDVDAVRTKGVAEGSDDSRDVLVGRVDHVRSDLRVDVDALDLDEPGLAIAEHRSRD